MEATAHAVHATRPVANRARFALCPPDYFDTHFLFNPFMTYRQKVDRRRARAQWKRLRRALEHAGAQVEIIEPAPVTSALTFSADGALVYAPGRALVLRNDGPRGDYEPGVFKAWLTENGFTVESLPPGMRMDGGNLLRLSTGDVVAGLKPSALGRPEAYLRKLLRVAGGGGDVTTVRLVDRRYLHLDTAMGVLRDDLLLVYRPGLLEGRLPDSGPLAHADVIDVDEADARCFGCNIVVVGDVVITGPISDSLARRIGEHGYHVERVDLSEFYKAGGGAKCLTLPLWPLGSAL